ncbi:MAG: aminotransferase class I/II-fold pyridoxal phosphate-dependent enzyme [Tannerella sp.]|jgi:dTDP-4-amino-4,6-dideoxygalactose transaminase|nr:aminotransferase class I/II-fold pyridoxal phosphate-dependent enzyme [Tannerella sp.]
MKSKLYLSTAHMGDREHEFVQEAFDSNWITPLGPNVDLFENDLEQYLDNEVYVTALSTGTAALHLALILLGVKNGDEVLCQSMTFSASANPIVYQGATPIFIDSEKETWNLSPEILENAIKNRMAKGKKPKALILVHLYGMPVQMDDIAAIARKYEIPIIEDAAEALGSAFRNRRCGTWGDFSILSFNGNKIITTSGGGALVSKNETAIRKARFLATQARDDAPHYQHSHIGYNYRMSNVLAGIGRGQMCVLPERVAKRRSNHAYYKKHLSEMDGIRFQTEPSDAFYSNYWLTTILVDENRTNGITHDDLRLALEKDNIESRPLWKPMHLQPVFASAPFYGDGTSEKLFSKGLCLPSGSTLTEEDLDRVIRVLKDTLSGKYR